MVLLESLNLPMGSKAHDFNLPGIDGADHSLESYNDAKVLVLVFMCNHCPYVLGVIQRLIKLQEDFKDKGVQFVAINANESDNYPEDGFDKMPDYAKDWGMNFPYLRDESQEVAKTYQAECTPDIFVFDNERKLAYHGRIDDNWQHEDEVTKEELRAALDALVTEKKVFEKQNPSMGCSIKWK
ncbi:thioredoxin family protein [Patescibacteria group bacterium]